MLYDADIVVRITGDCPLVDGALIDEVLAKFLEREVDYVSNISPATYPDGLDIEVFSLEALKRAWEEVTKYFDQEHVTPYIRESAKFKKLNIANTEDLSDERWTVEQQDQHWSF